MPIPSWAKPLKSSVPEWAKPLQAQEEVAQPQQEVMADVPLVERRDIAAVGPIPQGAINVAAVPRPEPMDISKTEQFVRPTLEYGAMAAGGAVGAGSPIPGGTVIGGGLGYAAGKNIADIIYRKETPKTTPEALLKTAEDVAMGGAMEMGGQILGKVVPATAKAIGKGAKNILGKLTGAGTGAIEEAIESGTKTGLKGYPLASKTAFDKALRGEISGEEIAAHAKDAFSALKEMRGAKYKKSLEKIGKITGNIDLAPAKEKIFNSLKKYVRISHNGQIDWSRSALGPEKSEGIAKLKEIVKTIKDWGSKEGDATPLGLDMLKRQLDDFYSESSNARSLVASARNVIKNTLEESVPEYAKMTKSYSEATSIIKDIETGLMLRKQGMSGRIVADQTLRRLISSMKDNFALRRDLVKALENPNIDLSGEIAGYAMNSITPRGLAGSGPALVGGGALAGLNPKLWPLLAASSPRVTGEFLRLFGKGLVETRGAGMIAGKISAYAAGKTKENKRNK